MALSFGDCWFSFVDLIMTVNNCGHDLNTFAYASNYFADSKWLSLPKPSICSVRNRCYVVYCVCTSCRVSLARLDPKASRVSLESRASLVHVELKVTREPEETL